MPEKIRLGGLLLICFLAAAVFSGCGREKEPVPQKTEDITIALARLEATALVRIALRNGYFREEGLNARVREYELGTLAFSALLSGQADIATVSQTTLVKQAFERKDFVIVGTIHTSDNNVKLIARRDRGIKNPLDLAGKKIGLSRWTVDHFFLYSFLTSRGLTLEDVELADMSPSELVTALDRGEIDGFVSREPNIFRAQEKLGPNAITFSGEGIYTAAVNLVVREAFARKYPFVLGRVYRALIRAENFVKDSGETAIRIISEDLGLDRGYIEKRWDESSYELSLDQSLLSAMEVEARWMIRNNLVFRKKMPNFYDFIYIDELEDVKPRAVTVIH